MLAALLRMRAFFGYHVLSFTALTAFVLSLFLVWVLGEIKLAAFKSEVACELAALRGEIAEIRADMHQMEVRRREWVEEFRANNPERWDIPEAPARGYVR